MQESIETEDRRQSSVSNAPRGERREERGERREERGERRGELIELKE
jgi:hypothetical protein